MAAAAGYHPQALGCRDSGRLPPSLCADGEARSARQHRRRAGADRARRRRFPRRKACRTAWRHRRLQSSDNAQENAVTREAHPPRKVKSAARRHQRRPALYRAYGKNKQLVMDYMKKNAGPARRVHDSRRGLRLRWAAASRRARPGRYDHRRHRLYRRRRSTLSRAASAGSVAQPLYGSADERDRTPIPSCAATLPLLHTSLDAPLVTRANMDRYRNSCRTSTTGTHKRSRRQGLRGSLFFVIPAGRLCSSPPGRRRGIRARGPSARAAAVAITARRRSARP